jgi:hypothetical protein
MSQTGPCVACLSAVKYIRAWLPRTCEPDSYAYGHLKNEWSLYAFLAYRETECIRTVNGKLFFPAVQLYIYIYIYIYMCVCVCVCHGPTVHMTWDSTLGSQNQAQGLSKRSIYYKTSYTVTASIQDNYCIWTPGQQKIRNNCRIGALCCFYTYDTAV